MGHVPWESLAPVYREELFSKLLQCQRAQPEQRGASTAQRMHELLAHAEHLKWTEGQWERELQEAAGKVLSSVSAAPQAPVEGGQVPSSDSAALQRPLEGAGLLQRPALPGSGTSARPGVAATKIAESQRFTYQRGQRTVFTDVHAAAIAAVLDEELLNDELLRADTPKALKALAVKVVPKLGNGLIAQHLGDKDRLSLKLKDLRHARLLRRDIDAMSDVYFALHTHPTSVQATVLKPKIVVPDLYVQCFALAKQLGAWTIRD